uniref:C2H2-type domain-containing protein n=1 Tax=Cacopsylla melanoneura TaxID=428564 RepID=A0A8D8YWU0_9HEMI
MSYCRLCGSPDFLVNISDHQNHLEYLHLIDYHLSVKLPAADSHCLVCATCVAQITYLRQWKRKILNHQSLLSTNHEPPSVCSDNDTSVAQSTPPEHLFYNSQHEEFNPSILVAESLAHGVDPLSVSSIKRERVDPAESNINTSHSSIDQIEIEEHPLLARVKQEPCTPPSLVPRHNDRYHSTCSTVPGTDSRYDVSSQNKAVVLSAASRSFDFQTLVHSDCADSQLNSTDDASARVVTLDEPPGGGAVSRSGKYSEQIIQDATQTKNSKNLLIECYKCGHVVIAKDDMDTHWLDVHNVNLRTTQSRRISRYQSKQLYYRYVCTICEKKFDSYNGARTHRKVHRPDGTLYSEDGALYDANEDNETSGDEVTIDVDERLNNLDENLIEALSKVEDLFSKREASEGIPSRGSHADETNSALTSDVKNSSQNERTDQKRTEACSAELQPLDDKARVKFDILRNELFDTHFQHVSERPSFRLGRKHDITNSKSNTIPHDKTDGELDVNVKIETLDTLVKRWSKSELATSKTELVASEEIVRACYRRQWNTVQENSNDRTGNDSLNDSSELEDSKVSLLSVIVKTENVHNDALEENSDYKDMSNMNNNNSNTVMNSNKSRADHFLGFASSENCTRSASCTNNAENSLGDDQHTFSSNKVDGSPEVKDAQVPEVKDNYQCNLCNVYFDTIPLLGEHMKSHTFEVMKSNYLKGLNTHTEVMCELCSTVVNVIRFKQHLKIVHSHADYPIPDALVIPTGGVRCCICKEEFKRTAMYESHRKTCYIESMIMRQLKRVANQMNSENSKNILEIELKQTPHQARNGSDSKRDLKKPLNQYDVQQTRRSADATGNREEKLISSENTKIKKRGSNKYDCAKCGLACETKLGFDIHRIFHGSPHTRGNFSCLECNVTWTSVTAARNHLKRQHLHVENSVTLCAHCLQTFPDKNRYNGHFKKMMVQPALTKNGKSSESEDEETPSDESEDEADKNDSAELMDTLKKNLGLELSQAIASAVETSTPGRTEASPTTKRMSKELKMLSINANFTPAEWSEDKRPRRREVESSDVTMSSRHSGSSSSNSNLTTRSNSPVLLSDKIKNVQFQELKEKIRAAMIAVKSAKASEEKKDNKSEAEARGGKHSSDSSRTGEHRTEGELMNNSDEFYFDHKGHPRKIFTCPRCSMRFITELVYEDHVEKCGKDMFKSNKNGGVCSLCNIYFTELRKHNVVHGNANHRFHTQEKYIYVYQCPICLADSKQDIGRFNRHLEECKAKGAGHMKCKHCKRLCSNLSNKMRHQIACSAQLARAMFRKAKTPLLKCTYCCRHIQQTREAHDKICLKPIVGYATPTTSKPEKRKRVVPHNVKIVVVSALSPNTTQVTPPVVPDQTNVDQDDSDTETINKCDKCDKTFPLRIAYKKHISKCTGAAKESPSEQVSTTAKALPSENESTGNQSSGAVSACLSCFLCDHSNETSVHLFNHYTRKHHLNIEVSGPPSRRQYKCLYCHKQCNSFMKFNLHGHFHEKQKNSLNKKEKKEKESFQTETTSERQKSVTPTVTNTTEPMKTRDKSKASVEKQPDFTSKKGSTENSQSSPRGSESALITRSGTVVSRAHVEDSNTSVTTPTTRNRSIMSPARASTSSSSQSQSRDSNSSDSPNTKERKWKSLTENAKIMNSYKKTKPQHKKSTKCESCKEYIRNTCYTQHAVKCVSSSIRNPKRTKNDIIMSGYVKKKNKAPRMMCIHCKLYISGRKFATHLSKCERKSSYRNIQRTSDVGKEKIPANESQVRPNTRHNEASGSKHTEIMAPRPSFKKIEIINLEPIVNTRRNETDALKSKTIEVMLSKPSLKNVEIIPLKSPSRKIEVPQPVKKKLEGFPPKLSPTVPITKKPESTVYKPAQRKVEITPVTSPRNKLDVSPKNSSCINESPSKAIKVIEVNYTKPGSKHVVVPPPTVVVPSPRDTSPRIRKSRNSIEPSKVFCPLCSTRTEIHKENVSSHYNYYHKQELSLSMYLEVLGLKPDNTQCFIQTSTMYCPLCEKTYEKSEMRNHYRYHRRDLNYSLFIEVLGFRNETDFVDFIENNENRLTRITRRSKTAPVEIIDLEQQNVEKSPQERRKKSLENVVVVAPQANTSKGTLTLASETRSSRRTRGHPEPEPIKPSEIEEKRITRKRDRSKQLDENLSLADLLDIKRRRENPTNTDTRPSRPVRNRNIVETSDPIVLNETPTSTNTRPNRPIRTRNILETSDPIILNEDDAGELSDAAEDDPLADPFGGCGDQADMVDKPIDRSDEESMGGMNEIAVLEDWGSLEKKTTEEKEEGVDMSKDELEKKRQLQEKIKNQLQKKIDAILNKNIAEAEARKKQIAASKTKIPSPAAVPKPKTMTPSNVVQIAVSTDSVEVYFQPLNLVDQFTK